MLAIVAAVLFLLALVFELAGLAIGPLDGLVFITAGLLCWRCSSPGSAAAASDAAITPDSRVAGAA